MALPSAPVATVQLPLPSLAVQVMVWGSAIAKVAARHKSAKAPPTVLLTVCNIVCFSLCAGGYLCVAPLITLCRTSKLAEKRRFSLLLQSPSQAQRRTFSRPSRLPVHHLRPPTNCETLRAQTAWRPYRSGAWREGGAGLPRGSPAAARP